MARIGWTLGIAFLGASVFSLAWGQEYGAYSPAGLWRVVDATDGGYVGSEDPATAKYLKRCSIRITKDRFQNLEDDKATGEYKIVRVDTKCQPAAIDLLHSDSGTTYRGIWKREGNRLWVCIQFVLSGDSRVSVRPKSFDDAKDDRHEKLDDPMLIILEPK